MINDDLTLLLPSNFSYLHVFSHDTPSAWKPVEQRWEMFVLFFFKWFYFPVSFVLFPTGIKEFNFFPGTRK